MVVRMRLLEGQECRPLADFADQGELGPYGGTFEERFLVKIVSQM